MLNISAIKEHLHKPAWIQWNIAGTLPRKLKRKIPRVFSDEIFSPQLFF